jgi:hypothetical protein
MSPKYDANGRLRAPPEMGPMTSGAGPAAVEGPVVVVAFDPCGAHPPNCVLMANAAALLTISRRDFRMAREGCLLLDMTRHSAKSGNGSSRDNS